MQHRSVFCGASDGVAVVKLDEIECHLEPRPEVELECLEQKCDGAWFVGPFGKVSSTYIVSVSSLYLCHLCCLYGILLSYILLFHEVW